MCASCPLPSSSSLDWSRQTTPSCRWLGQKIVCDVGEQLTAALFVADFCWSLVLGPRLGPRFGLWSSPQRHGSSTRHAVARRSFAAAGSLWKYLVSGWDCSAHLWRTSQLRCCLAHNRGAAVRTASNTTTPIFVSVGHRIRSESYEEVQYRWLAFFG